MNIATEQVEEALQPINNGVFNHEMTDEQMIQFGVSEKIRMAWHFIATMGSTMGFMHVEDKIVFPPYIQKWTYDALEKNADNIDEILISIRQEYKDRYAELLRLTAEHHFNVGQRIYDAQHEFQFGGALEMEFGKLIGYLDRAGNWNKFKGKIVGDKIQKLEEEVPKFYRRNNCNNGRKNHVWAICGDYIFLKFSYLNETEARQYVEFYETHWEPTGHSINADSIRYELTEIENGLPATAPKNYTLELIWWWD